MRCQAYAGHFIYWIVLFFYGIVRAMSQPKLFRIIDKAMFDYNLIENGDNILVGVSGGKDSTSLVHYFSQRRIQKREDFSFTAVHIHTDISPPLSEELVSLFKSWNVDLRILRISVLERLKEGKKMNCWWCSTQRRTELNSYAIENGFNKIALGHHLDDMLETLVMNVLSKGELSTMPPYLSYEKYPVTVIRPLILCDEKTIISHAVEHQFKSATCTCTYQDNSARKDARKKIADLTQGKYDVKMKIVKALQNIKSEYLP